MSVSNSEDMGAIPISLVELIMEERRLSFSQYFRWLLYILNKSSRISSQELVKSWTLHRISVDRYLARQRNKPCQDCWKLIPGLMSLDHLPEFQKSFDFTDAGFYPFKAVMEEVAKTQTVCRPCHDLREEHRLFLGIKKNESTEQRIFGQFFHLIRVLSGTFKKRKRNSTRKHLNRSAFYQKVFREEPEGSELYGG